MIVYNTTLAWEAQVKKLLEAPEIIIRGQKVREIIGCRTITNMSVPYVDNAIRNVSNKFRANEAYWILSGDNRVSTIDKHAPSIANFSDNGHMFQGAYGPKITEQLRYAVDTLSEDIHSRQAVINIWRENPRASKDIPCTLSLQFLIRDGHIHCIATMRSSDIWLGWVYDIFNFSCVAQWIALELSHNYPLSDAGWKPIPLGYLTINIGSSHLYERNYANARRALAPLNQVRDQFLNQSELPPNLQSPNELMTWLKNESE